MNLLPIVYDRSTVHEPSAAPSTSATNQVTTTAVTAISDADGAANEDAAAATHDYVTNPLWVIAAGMGFFFALLTILTS